MDQKFCFLYVSSAYSPPQDINIHIWKWKIGDVTISDDERHSVIDEHLLLISAETCKTHWSRTKKENRDKYKNCIQDSEINKT